MTQETLDFTNTPPKTVNMPKSCVPVSQTLRNSSKQAAHSDNPAERRETQLNRQERIIYDIIQEHQPVISAKLIGYGLERYVGCGDKIARNLRFKKKVDSRKVEGKNYVEWYVI